jgi:hypothetical protein
MKIKIIALLILFHCHNQCVGQSSFALGIKGSLARITDTGGPNLIGNFLVVSDDMRTKPMGQIYARFGRNRFYVQPEIRYSTYRFYTRYENVDRDNPKWSNYRDFVSQNIAEDQVRIDVPVQIGYFVRPTLSVSAGLIASFIDGVQRPFAVRNGRRFSIADDVFDSQKKQSLGVALGLHYHRNRVSVNIEYDRPITAIGSDLKGVDAFHVVVPNE